MGTLALLTDQIGLREHGTNAIHTDQKLSQPKTHAKLPLRKVGSETPASAHSYQTDIHRRSNTSRGPVRDDPVHRPPTFRDPQGATLSPCPPSPVAKCPEDRRRFFRQL